MVFSSLEFVLLFLPLTWLAAHFALQRSTGAVTGVLLLASLLFYGIWNWRNLFVLVPLALATYAGGRLYQRSPGWFWPAAMVAVNLAALGYFKYLAFFADTARLLWEWVPVVAAPALPLGISFFVFQKIAFIVDIKRGVARPEGGLVRFLLFVSFFPQLIAGPIVHWRQLAPQLDRETLLRQRDVFGGLTLFAIGLAKKTLIADLLSPYVGQVFDGGLGKEGALSAWAGVLAYTLQIYFDFSGYSDMAVGLALMFGVRLPWNFLSPYKATSIIEFWRRWHITLSQFLRDYVYIPLGGNRGGSVARHRNVMLTMLLGGLWHGAGWNFVLWGGLHGAMIVVNHLWRATGRSLPGALAWLLTLLTVALAWVPFRAGNLDIAMDVYAALAGAQGRGPAPSIAVAALLALGLCLALLAPNARQIAETWLRSRWMPLYCGLLAAAAIVKQLYAGEIHEFIYFRF